MMVVALHTPPSLSSFERAVPNTEIHMKSFIASKYIQIDMTLKTVVFVENLRIYSGGL